VIRRVRVLALIILLLLTVPTFAASKAAEKQVQRINPAALSAPNGYSHVVVTQGGRTIYVSGQVPLTKDGKLIGAGNMEAQTRQVFENLKAALAGAGAEVKDLVKINIYTTDASQLPAIRKVRDQYIQGDLPTSTFMEVKALFRPDVMIEIDGIAVAK
jgi:2-iminobutanoate/2-iminopropanoate deaminase